MASDLVNVGTLPNDGTGAALRSVVTAFNGNFDRLDDLVALLQGSLAVAYSFDASGNFVITFGDGSTQTIGTSLVNDTDLLGYQPKDADLTAIAALATAAFGRSILTQADAAAARLLFELGSAALKTAGAAAGNVPVLDSNGVLPISTLPASASVSAFSYWLAGG